MQPNVANGKLLLAVAFSAALHGALPASAAVIEELHAQVPQDLIENGIDIAVFNDWAPDEFLEDGQLKGWSVELSQAISDRLGVSFNYVPTGWDAIIPGLISGRFDAAFASMGATEERLKSLDFVSQRTAGTGFAFLKSSGLKIEEREDVCGHSSAIINGSWDHDLMETLNAEVCSAQGLEPIDIQTFSSQSAAELAVQSGRVDMTAAARAKLVYMAKNNPVFEVGGLEAAATHSCIGVPKDSEIGPLFTAVIQALIEDGTYEQIMGNWGLNNDSMLSEAVLITETNPTP
ncbi:transporter substrate-binding domain-containing protein [Salipiger sp. PrR003]|uniref:transporter substrate-binding domain-containing protein n=1 Tax=Salipiger sp. PrR003 TaxID=2706776 RepID=UPI0013D98166|nr:transporter substrate-binding domain-containing protein [Salipiger sp. PrR003]NDV49329.1 transporter substrate-binding domain-containing protein [Salipiger sp. PrR003]